MRKGAEIIAMKERYKENIESDKTNKVMRNREKLDKQNRNNSEKL